MRLHNDPFLPKAEIDESAGQPSRTHLYSCLGGDLDMGELVELFVEAMPDRKANLVAQMDAKNWEDLRRTVHQLKGAAGRYRFDQITPFAAKLEASVRDVRPEDQIRANLDELVELYSRVRAGEPS